MTQETSGGKNSVLRNPARKAWNEMDEMDEMDDSMIIVLLLQSSIVQPQIAAYISGQLRRSLRGISQGGVAQRSEQDVCERKRLIIRIILAKRGILFFLVSKTRLTKNR
jgi:hypothetical protein